MGDERIFFLSQENCVIKAIILPDPKFESGHKGR